MTTLFQRKLATPLRRRRTRVDKSIKEQLEQQFRSTPYRELFRVVSRVQRGIAILDGEVSSFYLKQIAQTLAKRVPGVHSVMNHIAVRPHDEARRRLPFDWID